MSISRHVVMTWKTLYNDPAFTIYDSQRSYKGHRVELHPSDMKRTICEYGQTGHERLHLPDMTPVKPAPAVAALYVAM